MAGPLAALTKGKERIKSKFGKGSPVPVSPGEALTKKKESFLSSHALAEKRIVQLRKTPGADRSDKVKRLVTATGELSAEIKKEGQDATTVEMVDQAGKRLSEIYTKANEATTACTGPNMDAFEKARDKARARIGDMRQLPGAATYLPLQSRITAADDVFAKATELAREAVNAAEVKAQIDALNLISKIKDEAKKNSENFLKNAPKNIGEFEKKRKSASDRLAEVRSLRGTTDDPETANRLQNAENILEDITKKARAAATPEKVEEQIKRLESIETLAKSVESLSKDVKKRAQGDVKALPKWNEMLIEAEKARDSLMDIGVAKDEYIALTNLIASCRLKMPKEGAGQALKDLSEYTKLVSTANKKQQDLKNKVPPVEVLTALAKLSPLLKQLEKLAPEYLAKMHGDESDRLVYLGQTDPAKAVTGLEALVVTAKGDLDTVQKQKTDAEKKAVTFGTKKDELVKAGYREAFFTVAAQLGKLASEIDIPARDWGRAVERLDNAISLVGEVETVQKKGKDEWEKRDAKRKEMRKFVLNLLSWPPLVPEAGNLLDSLNELDQQFQATGDYAACQANYLAMNLDAKETALREAVRDTADMPDLESLKELRQKYTDAYTKLRPVISDADTRFMLLGRVMKDTADPTSSKLHEELRNVEAEWEAIMNNPTRGAEPDVLVLPFIDRAKEILGTADGLLKDPKKQEAFGKEANAYEARNPKGRLPGVLTEMMNQLERNGLALPQQRQTLKDLMLPPVSAETRAEGLLKLQAELKDSVAAVKKLETDRVARTKEAVNTAVKEPLKRIKGRHREFQDYQKNLETQADDIEAMTDSDDPYFLKTARLETVTLAKKVAAVDPTQRGDQGARYKAVEDRWASLRKGLAGDMKELLPNTHAALRSELATLIGKSRKLPPAEALKVFDDIEPRIQAAGDRLAGIKAEKEKYKLRRERLEKQWAQVKKETKTSVTDRVTEFAKSLEIRLGEADAALKEENGFRRANTILKGLEDKLRKVETSGDPRAALQKMDSDVAQDQRAIRDMARAFEEELKYFKETTIPRARTLIKERAAAAKSLADKVGDKVKGAVSKLTETKVGGNDLDKELLESLESTLKNAPKPVQSYLDMISTTTIGAAKAPELSTAKAAFQSARGMIVSATRTVDALKTTTGGADMTVTQDLKKVQANWIAQTQNYAKVVRAMVGAIRKSAENETDEVKTAATKAEKAVNDAAAVFHATAFEGEFREMQKEGATKDAKLAAREKALTTMRAYRKLLLEHPVHKQLADSANPFADGSSMRAAARGILIGLKRIELETLVN